ncbi:MAG: glycosyltransferase family 2 protein [Planctomycetota bacterium]
MDDALVANDAIQLSIVVPALNEVDNVGPLVDEVEAAMNGRIERFELIVVDDGSDDGTDAKLTELAGDRPWLRVLRREQRQGQSSAMAAGIFAARGEAVAFLDADLQNDPAELPDMFDRLHRENVDLVQGDRSRNRRDSFMKRRASVVGRTFRRVFLGDTVRDTGCSARVLRASYAKRLPLEFKGMHRFIPAFSSMLGANVVEHEVVHRSRAAGVTKYGVGVFSRGAAGFMDLLAVRWMGKRLRPTETRELTASN